MQSIKMFGNDIDENECYGTDSNFLIPISNLFDGLFANPRDKSTKNNLNEFGSNIDCLGMSGIRMI